jgi:hypothetical protein
VVLPTVTSPKYNQTQKIQNFGGLIITNVVKTTSDQRVEGTLVKLCDIASGLPGGGQGGLLAPPQAGAITRKSGVHSSLIVT